MCDKTVSYVQIDLGHGKGFELYEQDYSRLYIVSVSLLNKCIICFLAPAGFQIVLEKENKDYKEMQSVNVLPIQTKADSY